MIAIFAPETPYRVYEQKNWWNDAWNPLDYGCDYDFSKPFFQQFDELLKTVPLVNVFNQQAVNSDYCNHCEDSKDCYLLFASIWNENVSFSRGVVRSRDSFDILQGENLESCYNSIDCENCYRLFFSRECKNCNDSVFLFDCRNCSNCFASAGLRNKSYCIFNKQYSKEEYQKELKSFDLGSYRLISDIASRLKEHALKYPHKYAHFSNTANVVGDHVSHAKNCYYCFSMFQNTENCKYVAHGGANFKDSYDGYGVGAGELMYESIDSGLASSRILFAVVGRGGLDMRYTYYCHESKHIFGCIGLRNKQYCILNKQYSKEEYETLMPQIIEHMNIMPFVDKKGRIYKYGEFFPSELSLFAYNETIAQEYFPLTREAALAQGYGWRAPEKRQYEVTLPASRLPDHIKEVPDTILGEVIGCAHESDCNHQCTNAFKIILPELQFLRKFTITLPRLCPNCRHYERLKQRNPLKLWHRKCMCAETQSENIVYANTVAHFHNDKSCPNEFETSYAPDRPEIVYCEQCYNAEIV